MKKTVKIILITALMFCVFSVTAYADMGSKPRVQITIKNQPQEKYYLDLLYQSGDSTIHDNIKWTDDVMYTTLYNYNDNGWVPALAKGTPMPIWGNLEPDENGQHIIGYYGVPDEFKIIIITESGQMKISDVISRKSMEISLTLDYNDMSYTSKPVWTAYIAQFVSTCFITIVAEFIILAMFFMAKKSNLKPFLKMNIITQLFMTVVLSTFFLNYGTFSVYMFLPVVELVIFIFEIWYSIKYFEGKDSLTKRCYAVVANGVSMTCTFLSLEKIMDFMFKVIR